MENDIMLICPRCWEYSTVDYNEKHDFKCKCGNTFQHMDILNTCSICSNEFAIDCYTDDKNPICVDCGTTIITDFESYIQSLPTHSKRHIIDYFNLKALYHLY